MISKKISREKKASDFERLGRYLVNAQTNQDAVMWTRTAEYVVDLKADDDDGEKVLWYRITNCEAEVPAMAIAEVQVTQSHNTRSKVDRTYHLVISFPEGESPSRAQLEDIEDQMCRALGFEHHQRISAVHQDTDNIHLHIAINKVNPKTFNIQEPFRDYYIRDRVCRELEKKHGLTVDNGIGQGQRYGKEQEMNAHSNEQTLWQWIQDYAKADLVQVAQTAESWQALHEQFAVYELVIKPRGNGLAVGVLDGKAHVKASSIASSLSAKQLEKRLGPYQPPEQMVAQPTKARYQAGPRVPDEAAQALFAAFQAQKQSVWEHRHAFKVQQKSEKEAFNQALKTWHQGERLKIKTSSLSAPAKRQAYHQLSQERQLQWETQRKKESEQRKAVFAAHSLPTWEQYLINTAENGNSKALELLRARRQKQWRMTKALLTADNLQDARDLIYPDLKPICKRSGEVVYRVRDGGLVVDERTRVRVDEVTAGSAFLALSLASERFVGQPLEVQGEAVFKEQVVQFAAQYRMPVTFKDAALEAERQRLCNVMGNQASLKSEPLSLALKAFITQRNQLRNKVSDILPHRAWNRDAGTMTYQGRRNLTDGSQAVLLQQGNEMLVKPVQAHEFQGLNVGQSITMTEQGQMKSQTKGRGR